MNKPRRRIATAYLVHTGRASWHQAKAGHSSSAVGLYWRKHEAMVYMRRFRKLHPWEPCFVTTERRIREFTNA